MFCKESVCNCFNYVWKQKRNISAFNFKNSITVPTQYKRTAAVLKEALENKKILKKSYLWRKAWCKWSIAYKIWNLFRNLLLTFFSVDDSFDSKDIKTWLWQPRCNRWCYRKNTNFDWKSQTFHVFMQSSYYGANLSIQKYKDRLLEVINDGKEIDAENIRKEGKYLTSPNAG